MPALTPALEKSLNHHVTQELAASHGYLASAAALHEAGLRGMAKWMTGQSDEERGHAMRFYDYIHQRHGSVRLEQIPAPPKSKPAPRGIFDAALRLEVSTTARIRDLHSQAVEAKDVALRVFLESFLVEQVEEEDQLNTILDRFKLAGDDPAALLLLDQELGATPEGSP